MDYHGALTEEDYGRKKSCGYTSSNVKGDYHRGSIDVALELCCIGETLDGALGKHCEWDVFVGW